METTINTRTESRNQNTIGTQIKLNLTNNLNNIDYLNNSSNYLNGFKINLKRDNISENNSDLIQNVNQNENVN